MEPSTTGPHPSSLPVWIMRYTGVSTAQVQCEKSGRGHPQKEMSESQGVHGGPLGALAIFRFPM